MEEPFRTSWLRATRSVQAGKYSKAIEVLMSIAKDHACEYADHALVEIANAYELMRDYPDAWIYYERALETMPDNSFARMELHDWLSMAMDMNQALKRRS